jgi:hypothetical protein
LPSVADRLEERPADLLEPLREEDLLPVLVHEVEDVGHLVRLRGDLRQDDV